MSNINMVIVPVWLNLIQKELGIADADLANYEKVSGILSPRDLFIYKMLNWQSNEVFSLLGESKSVERSCHAFSSPIPTPTLEEIASMMNQDIETLIFGATGSREGQDLLADAEMVDSEVLVVRLISSKNAPDSVKECSDCIATKITKVLHGRIPLIDLAKSSAFKLYVNAAQINPLFY